jgi:hypothetical protein
VRFKRAIAVVLGLVATVCAATAAPGSAEGRGYQPLGEVKRAVAGAGDFQTQATDGSSFIEVNGAGNLVFWQRSGDSFSGHVRGWGWQGARIVSTLNRDTFVEVKGDGRLAKWSWDGGAYHEQIVGWGWQNARLLTGVSWNRFLEVNQAGNLVLWTFDGLNNLSSTTIGWGWGATRSITGLADLDFMEVKGNGQLSEWIDEGGLREYQLGADFSSVRLMAGLDSLRFVLIDGYDGSLWEFTYDPSTYYWSATQRGWGWGATRLLG